MARIFVSYSREDTEPVDRLAAGLRAHGHTVSIDRQSITVGDNWRQRLVDEIDNADALVVALSAESVASDQVRREVELAFDRDGSILMLPVLLGHIKSLGKLRHHLVGIHRIDLLSNFEAGLSEINKSLNRAAPRQVPKGPQPNPTPQDPLQAIMSDPNLTTQEKIAQYIAAYPEHMAKTPQGRKAKELEERIAKFDEEIANSINAVQRNALFDARQKARQELHELNMKNYDEMIAEADGLINRYDRMINSILRSMGESDKDKH